MPTQRINTGIYGFDKVLHNLNTEIGKITGATEKGAVEALAFIRYQTEHSKPKTPVDYGNLRASWFISTAKRVHKGATTGLFKNNPTHRLSANRLAADHTQALADAKSELKKMSVYGIAVMGGYSANYAAAVHENIKAGFGRKSKRADGKYKSGWGRPGSGPKWLQFHFQGNTQAILKIIALNAKVK